VQLTRSELEARFLDLCRSAGLPPPRANHVVEGMEVDFCWPELRLIVETDGWAYHGTRAAFSRDRRRSVTLTVAGWTVLRFTYEDVVHDPDHVVQTLRQLGVGDISAP
jgi:very-short-patch-repair endonuclease